MSLKQRFLSGSLGKYVRPVRVFNRWLVVGFGSNASLCLTIEGTPGELKFSVSFPLGWAGKFFGWEFDLPLSQIEKIEIRKAWFGPPLFSFVRKPPCEIKLFVFIWNRQPWLDYFKKAGLKLEEIP